MCLTEVLFSLFQISSSISENLFPSDTSISSQSNLHFDFTLNQSKVRDKWSLHIYQVVCRQLLCFFRNVIPSQPWRRD